MRRVIQCLVASALPFALSGCPPAPPSVVANPFVQDGDSVRHVFSGAIFPASAGPFGRVNVTQFDAAGKDVAASYALEDPSHPVLATVYVYPAPSLISVFSPDDVVNGARAHLTRTEFESREREIETSPDHSDVVRTSERPATNTFGSAPVAGWRAEYTMVTGFAGHRVAATSELEVYCFVGSKWCVEYRVTQPIATANGSDPLVELQSVFFLALSG